MGKYLFFDIDGTLLSDVTHTVPQSAIEAIKKAKENGHHCFFCTGRSYFMTKEISFTGIEDAIIANGAAVIRDGKQNYRKSFQVMLQRKQLNLLKHLEEAIRSLTGNMAIRIRIPMPSLKRNLKKNLICL